MVPVGSANDIAVSTLQPYVGAIVARSIVQVATGQCGVAGFDFATPDQLGCLVQAVENGVRAFLADANKADECVASLRQALNVQASEDVAVDERMIVEINEEYDIVTARGECRNMCARIGFPGSEQVKIATVVSELARNIVQYVGRGRIELTVTQLPHKGIEIVATDQGTGIPNIDVILSGAYQSKTGMGVGLVGTKRLMDDFQIDSGPTGTRIVTRKYVL